MTNTTNTNTMSSDPINNFSTNGLALAVDTLIVYQPAPNLDWHTAYVADDGRVWCLESKSAQVVFLDSSVSVTDADVFTLDSSDLDLVRAIQAVDSASTRLVSVRAAA